MKAMKDKWSAMIDITNLCQHQCTYCTKSIRHLRKDQRDYMDIDTFVKACDSLVGYPGKVCLTGGDPLCHPDFPMLCRVMAQTFPKSKIGIFTSHEQGIKKYKELIDLTFGEVYINLHTEEQKQVCCHQPYYLAVGIWWKINSYRSTSLIIAGAVICGVRLRVQEGVSSVTLHWDWTWFWIWGAAGRLSVDGG